MIGISGTVPINGNRGRATLRAVQSIHRVDSQLGRSLDINSAWRDPFEQEKLYNAYRAFLNGGPWAPIALRPEESVHCKGEAIDSDDGYNGNVVRTLNKNGWFHTVYRWENGVKVLKEPWHFEYDQSKDEFFGGSPAGEVEQGDDMPLSEHDLQILQQQHDITRAYVRDQVQNMHDVTRNYVRDQTQAQQNVTRTFIIDAIQKMHDVTRKFIVDQILAKLK